MSAASVGQKIRSLRRKNQVTQKKMSEALGCKASYVSLIERNARNLSVRHLLSVAKSLNVPPALLVTDEGSDFAETMELLVKLNEKGLKRAREYADLLVTKYPK